MEGFNGVRERPPRRGEEDIGEVEEGPVERGDKTPEKEH